MNHCLITENKQCVEVTHLDETTYLHLYETLQPAGHRQRVLAALQGVFQLLPLQTDLIKRHQDVHGSSRMGRGQMLRLLLRADETGEL